MIQSTHFDVLHIFSTKRPEDVTHLVNVMSALTKLMVDTKPHESPDSLVVGRFVVSQSSWRTSFNDGSGNHDVAVPAQRPSGDRFSVLPAASFFRVSFSHRVTFGIGQVYLSNMNS